MSDVYTVEPPNIMEELGKPFSIIWRFSLLRGTTIEKYEMVLCT